MITFDDPSGNGERGIRTKAGERNIDLIVEGADGRVVAIEVKLSAAVADADVRRSVTMCTASALNSAVNWFFT